MSGKKYRKKPTEVTVWEYPETMTGQFNLASELREHGADLHLYDYAVEHSDTRFKDGAFWRWKQAHIQVGKRSEIVHMGDIIIHDPVTGWGVMDADLFTQAYEEVTND
ncbi:MAG: hypothetical protein HLX50_00715 [Alteromonadaceae bacterium]|nr:hypothetical protein [Alteromonadaceae bacterium]